MIEPQTKMKEKNLLSLNKPKLGRPPGRKSSGRYARHIRPRQSKDNETVEERLNLNQTIEDKIEVLTATLADMITTMDEVAESVNRFNKRIKYMMERGDDDMSVMTSIDKRGELTEA